MTDMFCFQCQQTAGNKGCIRTGVCGKQPETANLQDDLIYELIFLAETARKKKLRTKEADCLFIDGLFTTLTNVNLGFEDDDVTEWFYKGLSEINKNHTAEEWLELIMEFGMELLDTANTESFGNPVPIRVNVDVKKDRLL